MTDLGVEVPPRVGNPPRTHAILASAIWLAVSLPFCYLAYLYRDWPTSFFVSWRGWVFALVALACVLMATIVPARYRISIVGTRLRWWGRQI